MSSTQSRRQFLTNAALTSVAMASGAVSGAPAKATGPKRIIDTHTHFYDPTRIGGVPWPPKNDPILYRPVFPPHYRAEKVPQRVNGTVVVEASPLV